MERTERIEGIREAANRVKVMGGWYGLDEKQTDALAEEVESLAKYHELRAGGLSDHEARATAWPTTAAQVN